MPFFVLLNLNYQKHNKFHTMYHYFDFTENSISFVVINCNDGIIDWLVLRQNWWRITIHELMMSLQVLRNDRHRLKFFKFVWYVTTSLLFFDILIIRVKKLLQSKYEVYHFLFNEKCNSLLHKNIDDSTYFCNLCKRISLFNVDENSSCT